MEKGNWIPVDKKAVSFLPKDRPYTPLEALYSLTVDVDNGKEGTIKGYAKLWQWDRSKVRQFVNELLAGLQHYPDRKTTQKRHPIRFVFNNLQPQNDTNPTGNQHRFNPTKEPNPISPIKGEEKDKGLASKRRSRTVVLSFEAYKRRFKPVHHEAMEAVEYFLKIRKAFAAKNSLRDHLPLHPEQWEAIVETILIVGDDDTRGADTDIDLQDCKAMIDRYFETKFRSGCDYSIVHFNNIKVKANRFFETAYLER